MSAICGIIHFKQTPVNQSAFSSMMASLSHRGIDGSNTLINDNIALGHHKLCITAESRDEILPIYHPETNVSITADIRLDNRDELIAALQIQNPNTPDSQLVLSAYRRWGTDLVDHLSGEYAIVIWDGNCHELYFIADHTGNRPIFYSLKNNTLVFSSEIKGIHASGLVAKALDKEFLAIHLSVAMTPHLLPERTFYKDVKAICSGHIIRFSADSVKETHYWVPDIEKRLNIKDEDEWREAFQEIFFRVVNAKLRSAYPITALLSGGLDSSSIVATASKLLQDQGKRLTTFSAVSSDQWRDEAPDERDYIDLFQSFANVDRNYITSSHRGPFSNIEQLVHNGDKPFFTSRHFLYSAFASAAKEKGSRVVLDGVMGELGPSFHSNGCLADLIRKGRWGTVSRELRLLSQDGGGWNTFKRHIIKPFLPSKLMHYLKPSEAGLMLPVHNHFIEDWADQALISDLLDQQNNLFGESVNHRKNQAQMYLRKARCKQQNLCEGYEQVNFSYPFSSPELIEFCLAAPEEMKIKNGYTRYMIRAGMKDILPPEICWRKTKEAFSPDYFLRFKAQQPELNALLSNVTPDDPIREIMDTDAMHLMSDAFYKEGGGNKKNGDALLNIPLSAYLFSFLRQFEEYQR